MSARDVIADTHGGGTADRVIAALTAAGYRIVPPGGLDAASVERCAQWHEFVARQEWEKHPDKALAHGRYAAAIRGLIEEPTNDAR